MTLYRGYEPAGQCTGEVTPGARALMAWHLGAYGGRGASNMGIYNCKLIPGSSSMSLHGEGRASDLGVPVGAPWAQQEADFLRLNSAELGVQLIIYNERVWSGRYPDEGWRAYSGVQRHHEHLHTELSWAAAHSLTAARISEVAAGWAVTPMPRPPSLTVDGRLGPKTIGRWQYVMGTPVDGVISRPSALVRAVQRTLNARIGAGLVVDGDGIRQDGRQYRTVRALQRYLGTRQDGALSVPVSQCVMALQARLNSGGF